VLVLVVTMAAFAQDAGAPALEPSTKDLMVEMLRRDQALAKVVQARVDAMLATKEGQAYQAAMTERQQAQKDINAAVAAKVPGFVLDFTIGRLVAATPAQAKK
jgi:predicted Zn-dependent protease